MGMGLGSRRRAGAVGEKVRAPHPVGLSDCKTKSRARQNRGTVRKLEKVPEGHPSEVPMPRPHQGSFPCKRLVTSLTSTKLGAVNRSTKMAHAAASSTRSGSAAFCDR